MGFETRLKAFFSRRTKPHSAFSALYFVGGIAAIYASIVDLAPNPLFVPAIIAGAALSFFAVGNSLLGNDVDKTAKHNLATMFGAAMMVALMFTVAMAGLAGQVSSTTSAYQTYMALQYVCAAVACLLLILSIFVPASWSLKYGLKAAKA